jgi:hypothetical protein
MLLIGQRDLRLAAQVMAVYTAITPQCVTRMSGS